MRAKGFTLIEILVAIAILAVALAATSRAASIATDGALESRQRLLATWTAENRVAEMRARRLFPSAGATQFRTTQAGLEMVVDETCMPPGGRPLMVYEPSAPLMAKKGWGSTWT